MVYEVKIWLKGLFAKMSFSDSYAEGFAILIMVVGLLLFSILVDRFSRKVLISSFSQFAKRSKMKWDNMLVKHRVFSAIAHIIPLLVILHFLPLIFEGYESVIKYIELFNELIILFAGLVVIFRILDAVKGLLQKIEILKDKPLQSYFQLFKILIGLLFGIFILSVLVNKSVMYFFGAFGAISAVLLLIFKDTILGFIASIQLAVNDMVRVGDWVQMDKYGADGDVFEINLTTVKVKNWDKTVTTVPTYSFISDSFKNWRGMQETGARRIARSILINQNSIKFCDEEMIERFKKIYLLKDYVIEKQKEIADFNAQINIDTTQVSNGRRMTNIGTFRAYLMNYLKNHPKISQDLTLLVRQMEPTPNGVPIQIYAFCSDIAWANYEGVQSDIFDHILAVISQFDLEVFQNPSGTDFRRLTN